LDVSKIKHLKPYVSFYNYTLGNIDYPSVSMYHKVVNYTTSQLNLWARLIYNVQISDSEAVLLELNDTLEDANLFKDNNNLDFLIYEDKGRIIGNLTGPDNQIPLKFIGILNEYISGGRLSTVVYSSFDKHGIQLFAKFLKNSNIEYSMITPTCSKNEHEDILKKFKDKKITLLLLHPNYYNGISISGMRVLHVLEPMRRIN
jgi:hypothetical protein